jgi:anti-anti-sigma factor
VSELKATHEIVGPQIAQLNIYGDLDSQHFYIVSKELDSLFSVNIYKIIINLKDTTFISSAGFGCFVSSLEEAIRNNGNLVFLSPPEEIREIFQALGLGSILRFASSRDEAIQILQSKLPAS